MPAAVEKYLSRIGHAVSFDEIYDALDHGGVKFTSNGRTILATAIRRSSDTFEKIKGGHIGLKEWYGGGIRRIRTRDPKLEETPGEIVDETEVKE